MEVYQPESERQRCVFVLRLYDSDTLIEERLPSQTPAAAQYLSLNRRITLDARDEFILSRAFCLEPTS